jgi:hypothetical protein
MGRGDKTQGWVWVDGLAHTKRRTSKPARPKGVPMQLFNGAHVKRKLALQIKFQLAHGGIPFSDRKSGNAFSMMDVKHGPNLLPEPTLPIRSDEVALKSRQGPRSQHLFKPHSEIAYRRHIMKGTSFKLALSYHSLHGTVHMEYCVSNTIITELYS